MNELLFLLGLIHHLIDFFLLNYIDNVHPIQSKISFLID